MLTPAQYRHAWYTITKPDFDGPLRVHTGFDKATAHEVCRGLVSKNEYCVVGFGFPHDLIGDQ